MYMQLCHNERQAAFVDYRARHFVTSSVSTQVSLPAIGDTDRTYESLKEPAAQSKYPRKTSGQDLNGMSLALTSFPSRGIGRRLSSEITYLKYSSSWQTYFTHEFVLPPPVSVIMACRPFFLSHAARGFHAADIPSVMHSAVWPVALTFK